MCGSCVEPVSLTAFLKILSAPMNSDLERNIMSTDIYCVLCYKLNQQLLVLSLTETLPIPST